MANLLARIAAAFTPVVPYSTADQFAATLDVNPWADSDALSRLTFEEMIGNQFGDHEYLSRREAESVPAVAACRLRVSGTLGRLPIVPTNQDGSRWAGSVQATNLITQPDPAEPAVVTFRNTYDDLFFDGCSFWAVTSTFTDGGQTRPWTAVHVPLTSIDEQTMKIDDRFRSWVSRSGRGTILDHPQAAGVPWLIYFDGPHAGLRRRPTAVRSAINLDRAAGHAADNPVPSIDLHQTSDHTMTRPEIQDMIDQWKAARRRGGVGYTNKSIEAKVLGQDSSQLLIDGRNQQAVEIARLAGLPAASIDAGIPGASLTYANLVDRMFDLVNMGLSNYAAPVLGRLSMADILPRGVRAVYDYAELYPAATASGSSPAPTGAGPSTPGAAT